MIADIIGDLHLAATVLWRVIGINLHLVLGAPDVEQQHVKVQHRIWGDDITCKQSFHIYYTFIKVMCEAHFTQFQNLI